MAQPENNINYVTASLLPPNIIINRAYNDDRQLEYEGHARSGTADSDPYWTIKYITYNANKQNQTERLAFNVAWDDRESVGYV